MARIVRVTLLIALVGCVVVGFVSWPSSAFGDDRSQASHRANVGFGRVLPDREIQSILDRCEVGATAAGIWTAGLGGAHRPPDGTQRTPAAFLADARSSVARLGEEGIQADLQRVGEFLETHAESEVVSNDDLEVQARSLLNALTQVEQARTTVSGGSPIVFRMEVIGSTSQIECLRQDVRVKEFQEQVLVGGRWVAPETPTPDAYQNQQPWEDASVHSMSAREVYQSMQARVSSAR